MKATGRRGSEKAPLQSPAPDKAGATASAEERRLVEAAQNDPARFDALYELHFDRVFGFVAGRVHFRRHVFSGYAVVYAAGHEAVHDRVTAEYVTSDVF